MNHLDALGVLLGFAVLPVLAFIEIPNWLARRANRRDFAAIKEYRRASDALVTRGWN